MLKAQTTWKRISDSAGDGYMLGDAKIWDNGAGVGAARGSGRWALEVGGKWVANLDTLAEAKAVAVARMNEDRTPEWALSAR